jgi:hypothetical protein
MCIPLFHFCFMLYLVFPISASDLLFDREVPLTHICKHLMLNVNLAFLSLCVCVKQTGNKNCYSFIFESPTYLIDIQGCRALNKLLWISVQTIFQAVIHDVY